MGVPGDELPAWWRGAGGNVSPYDGVTPWDAKSPPVRFSWSRPETVDIDGVRGALTELSHILGFYGRFCPACYNDLGDLGSPRSSTPTGYTAATGLEKDTEPPPQGGHEPECPVAYLVLWLQGKPSCWTRIRPAALRDTESHVVTPQAS